LIRPFFKRTTRSQHRVVGAAAGRIAESLNANYLLHHFPGRELTRDQLVDAAAADQHIGLGLMA
jgi:hypothetical protein